MNHEHSVLATAIEAGNVPLPPYISKLIQNAPESFDDPRAGQIAATVRAMRRDGEPIVFKAVGEKHLPMLTFICTKLSGVVLLLESAEYHAEKCWEVYQVRRLKTICEETVQSLNSSPKQSKIILAAHHVALDAINSEANSLDERLAARFIQQMPNQLNQHRVISSTRLRFVPREISQPFQPTPKPVNLPSSAR